MTVVEMAVCVHLIEEDGQCTLKQLPSSHKGDEQAII